MAGGSPSWLYWMPTLFEVRADDTRLMNDRQFRLYEQLLELAWREHWDLAYDVLPQLLRADSDEIAVIFELARGLYLSSGKVRHRRYEVEFSKSVAASDRARSASKKRWRNNRLKLVPDSDGL